MNSTLFLSSPHNVSSRKSCDYVQLLIDCKASLSLFDIIILVKFDEREMFLVDESNQKCAYSQFDMDFRS